MEKELYPVFRVDFSFAPYSIDERLIGAKDKKDLLANVDFKKVEKGWRLNDEEIEQLSIADYRIERVENVYTDKPYVVLETFSYYE